MMKIALFNTGMLGVNTYLVYDDETKKGFIVDPGGHSANLTAMVKEEGVDIEYIILTHGHSDHICGVNEHKADFANAKVLAHKDEEAMLTDANFNQSAFMEGAYTVKPDILVEDGQEIRIGGLTLKFLHTPGHTPGGMCIYMANENALFSGDTLFRQSIGRTDFPGGSFEALKDAVHNKLFVLPEDTAVLPGHMGPTDIGLEKRSNPFV